MPAVNKSIDLLHIQDKHHPAVSALQNIYEAAFPAEERREFSQLLTLLHQPDMFLYMIASAKEVAGLCIYWQLEGFYFLEHLAIDPAHQGHGLGKHVTQWLLTRSSTKLVLEVERPVDETSQRRIRFYQDLHGFTLHNTFDYHQPPYQRGGQPVPLYLMSAEPIADAAELVQVASHIKQQVYERFH
ncbi:GNAT family N-acetyltransferase [Pontibacter diazotrophicus]|uniref:GNAT family N-acetyltransferase n=1 Tax=Pontibacter diazotrophicus TaxID=1400979 RepID=A0A3D8LCG1_9BACT|nr:GNAT family N-acetyltransferase [Pontibacter diazotrophicus]RDV14964.1 GNAT family N-acetyltransferase [Pontibacter diazotrophicus]